MGKINVKTAKEELAEVVKAEGTVESREVKPTFNVKTVETEIKSNAQIEREHLEKDGLAVKQESHKVNLDTGKVRRTKGHDPLNMADRMEKLSVKVKPKKVEEDKALEVPQTPIEELSQEEIAESDNKKYQAEREELDSKFKDLESADDIQKMYDVYLNQGLDHEEAIWSIEHSATEQPDEYYRKAGIFSEAKIAQERLKAKVERTNAIKEYDRIVKSSKEKLYKDLEGKYKPKVAKKNEPKSQTKQERVETPKEVARQEEPSSDTQSLQEQIAAMQQQLADIQSGGNGFGKIKDVKLPESDEIKVKISADKAKGFNKGKRKSDYGVGSNWDVKPGTYATSEQRKANEQSGDFGDPTKWTINKA